MPNQDASQRVAYAPSRPKPTLATASTTTPAATAASIPRIMLPPLLGLSASSDITERGLRRICCDRFMPDTLGVSWREGGSGGHRLERFVFPVTPAAAPRGRGLRLWHDLLDAVAAVRRLVVGEALLLHAVDAEANPVAGAGVSDRRPNRRDAFRVCSFGRFGGQREPVERPPAENTCARDG